MHKDGSGGFVNGQNGCRLLGDHNDPDLTTNDCAGVTCHLCHRLMPNSSVEFLRDEAVLNAFPSENALCAGDRPPLATGPRTLSRGQYLFNLWSSPTYGKSPPVDMVTASASTSP